MLLAGDDGRELARSRMPGAVVEIGAEHDRLVASGRAKHGRLPMLVGVEAGRCFGRILWKRRHPGPEEPDLQAGSPTSPSTTVILFAGFDGAIDATDGAMRPLTSRQRRVLRPEPFWRWASVPVAGERWASIDERGRPALLIERDGAPSIRLALTELEVPSVPVQFGRDGELGIAVATPNRRLELVLFA